jgi:hypothetical protein
MAGILRGIYLAVGPPTRSRLDFGDLSQGPPFRLSSISERTGNLRVRLLSTPPSSNAARSAPKCNEKGCVFPAARLDTGKCRQHERQDEEPAIFHSRQPSVLLLDQAKFGPPDSDCEQREWRARDRRRLTRLWQTFQENMA